MLDFVFSIIKLMKIHVVLKIVFFLCLRLKFYASWVGPWIWNVRHHWFQYPLRSFITTGRVRIFE